MWATQQQVFPDCMQTAQMAEPVTFLPAAERIIAIGDLHGDVDKTRRALRLGGLIDQAGDWIGGSTVAVQVRRFDSTGSCSLLCRGNIG